MGIAWDLRNIALGIALGLLLAACAGAAFSYKYYGLEAASYTGGKLVGPTAADDLDFAVCKPTPANAAPCIVMVSPQFLALKQDYVDTKNALIACQKGK